MGQRKAQYRPRVAGVQRVTLATNVLPEARTEVERLAAESGQLVGAYIADLIGEHIGMPV